MGRASNFRSTQYELPLNHKRTFIHHIFESNVDKFPDKVALIDNDQNVSYRCLNAKVNQLAAYLVRRGVTLEVAVGICIYPSIDLIISILAVVKCGGNYVPLDQRQPSQRLQYIIENSDVGIAICEVGTESLLQGIRSPPRK